MAILRVDAPSEDFIISRPRTGSRHSLHRVSRRSHCGRTYPLASNVRQVGIHINTSLGRPLWSGLTTMQRTLLATRAAFNFGQTSSYAPLMSTTASPSHTHACVSLQCLRHCGAVRQRRAHSSPHVPSPRSVAWSHCTAGLQAVSSSAHAHSTVPRFISSSSSIAP